MKRSIIGLILLSFLSVAAHAQRYRIVDIASRLAPEYQTVDLRGLNDKGQVVGSIPVYGSTPARRRAFVHDYQSGTTTFLPDEAGANTWEANAINGSGAVVGSQTLMPSYNYRSYVYVDGQIQTINPFDTPILNYSYPDGGYANDINEGGQIVGVAPKSQGGSYVNRAYLWQNGQATDLGSLNPNGGGSSLAKAVNNGGEVVGSGSSTGGYTHAFLYSQGVMKDLGVLGSHSGFQYSEATSINDRGQVVGSSSLGNGASHAFLYENGSLLDLGTLGGSQSSAVAINAKGQIVGSSTLMGLGQRSGFLYENGRMIDLNTLIAPSDVRITLTSAISDKGVIAAYGQIGTRYTSFLLVPVPEPASMVALGLGVVAFLRKRRHA